MKVEPLTATIGAEIGGVDLASPLPDGRVVDDVEAAPNAATSRSRSEAIFV